ncbi:MAG: PLDc N-terminal domain-containing protein [Candidatus Aminicenantes bacterium]|nr:MAG: PLDc N-terminal domain-containing protein [Candidatus Aminicenantes bacterium]
MPSIEWLDILIVSVVLVLWIWGVVNLLKREVPRKDFYKWLGIIIIMPVVGFILYFLFGPRKK